MGTTFQWCGIKMTQLKTGGATLFGRDLFTKMMPRNCLWVFFLCHSARTFLRLRDKTVAYSG